MLGRARAGTLAELLRVIRENVHGRESLMNDMAVQSSRAAIYSRFSTDRQSESSPEDQVRLCSDRALSLRIDVVAYFEDRAVSGGVPIASRAGGRGLLAGALAGDFDVIVVEGLDRLSRDLVDQERVLRRLESNGLRVVGVKDGYDSFAGKSRKILRQVRGMINEIYRDDAADNTRRGQVGQFLRGFHAGGMCFGYTTMAVEGGRRLVVKDDEAEIVRWIFEQAGVHRRRDSQIANLLNERGVVSKRGGLWKTTAVRELLRQPLLTGKVIFGRFTWMKDPDSGRRRYRERPESEWLVRFDEALRIVSDAAWEAVVARNAEIWNLRGRATSLAVHAAAKRKKLASEVRADFGRLCCADCGSTRILSR